MWAWIVDHWGHVTADMLDVYGVDVADRALMAARPWSWLMSLLTGLFTARTRVLWEHIGDDARRTVRDTLAQGGQITPWR